MKLYLIGLPGSGKSFLGKQLADEAKAPFIDLDQVIEAEAGISIRKIFSEKGEDYFRGIEAVALRQQSKATEFVMACGGGTPCFHDNMKFINEAGTSVFINPSIKEILKRVNANEQETRPLLAGSTPEELEEKLKTLLSKRLSYYTQANLVINDQPSLAEILDRIKKYSRP